MQRFVSEPARRVPVAGEFDVCIVGGSCTGLFAAVRAARLGLSVALVERNILYGGMAVAAQVNEWHSLYDIAGERQIIGGMTAEVIERLRGRGAVKDHIRWGAACFRFNSAELALVLDQLVLENKIRPFLQGLCVGAVRDGGRVEAVIIEDKSGRRAIRARFFIDASGDGDALRAAGFSAWRETAPQPVSYQVLASGLGAPKAASELWQKARSRAGEFCYPLENGQPWFVDYPSDASLINLFGARLNGVDATDADSLSLAILEARRRQGAVLEMMGAEGGGRPNAVALAHALGVRESWHAACRHRLGGKELLAGAAYGDTVAYGTYPVDIHTPGGTLLRFLDGREIRVRPDGSETRGFWREPGPDAPRYYQIPFRSLIPQGAENFLVAGRLIDADRQAFGAVRIMVVMNQTGEAAGVAAALSLGLGAPPPELPPETLRNALAEGGSIFPSSPIHENAAACRPS